MKSLIDMRQNIAAYFKVDRALKLIALRNKFKDPKGNIPLMPVDFFEGFIDSMSNLYTNPFERTSENITIEVEDVLNECMEDAERYYHISLQSIVYVKSANEFIPFDASEYVLYPNENDYDAVFIQDGDDHVLAFKKNEPVARKETTLDDCQAWEDNVVDLSTWTPISPSVTFKTLPFVVIKHRRLTEPQKNELLDLEKAYIADMSWGMYNAVPKLLTQAVMKSDAAEDKTKEESDAFGRTGKMVFLDSTGELQTIDMGNLNNLKDIKTVWKEIINDKAVLYGVNKNAVAVTSELISGEAKKAELEYINARRNKFKRMFYKAERKICDISNELYNTKYSVTAINFKDILFGSDKDTTSQATIV